MKVIFIHLPRPHLKQPEAQAPMGLMYLSAVLEQKGIDVVIVNYASLSIQDALNKLPEAEFYGMTVTSMELPLANEFAQGIKRKYPKSKVALGGPGTVTDEFVNWQFIDMICKGEGEETIMDMLGSTNGKRIYHGKPIKDLNALPLPARHMMKDSLGGNIFAFKKNYKKKKSTQILTSRGCPFKCAFCANPSLTFGGVRYRSTNSVIEEIKAILNMYDIYQFRIADDMFTSNKRRLLDITSKMAELGIIYRISARVKPFDKEMATALYDSGCREISFGVESFDNEVLQVLRKQATAEDAARAIDICNEVGLVGRVLLMIKTPGQTDKTVPRNIRWLERLSYPAVSCTTFVPMPGSDIWDNPGKYGIEILSRNLRDYNFYFFGPEGERPMANLIRIKNRDMEEVNRESHDFREYLKSTGKINQG
jgi:radical SAM superfamily enzyme YgiQ (UPF0313 family)